MGMQSHSIAFTLYTVHCVLKFDMCVYNNTTYKLNNDFIIGTYTYTDISVAAFHSPVAIVSRQLSRLNSSISSIRKGSTTYRFTSL